jgi:hypothetical protein
MRPLSCKHHAMAHILLAGGLSSRVLLAVPSTLFQLVLLEPFPIGASHVAVKVPTLLGQGLPPLCNNLGQPIIRCTPATATATTTKLHGEMNVCAPINQSGMHAIGGYLRGKFNDSMGFAMPAPGLDGVDIPVVFRVVFLARVNQNKKAGAHNETIHVQWPSAMQASVVPVLMQQQCLFGGCVILVGQWHGIVSVPHAPHNGISLVAKIVIVRRERWAHDKDRSRRVCP